MATTTRTTRARKAAPARMAVATNGTRSAADAAVISITSKPRKTVDTLIDGIPYRVKLPKTALTMRLAVHGKQAEDNPAQFLATLNEWVFKVFGSDNGQLILDRLDNEKDDLDTETLTDLMGELSEVETGDPTS